MTARKPELSAQFQTSQKTAPFLVFHVRRGQSLPYCVGRGGAGAGGEATLAVQGLPAGAERVPAEATQATQVSLLPHVTSCRLDVKTAREGTETSGGETDGQRTRKQRDETVGKRLLGVLGAMTPLSLSLLGGKTAARLFI